MLFQHPDTHTDVVWVAEYVQPAFVTVRVKG